MVLVLCFVYKLLVTQTTLELIHFCVFTLLVIVARLPIGVDFVAMFADKFPRLVQMMLPNMEHQVLLDRIRLFTVIAGVADTHVTVVDVTLQG